MQTGIDVYLKTPSRLQRRVGVVAHPASVTQSGVHTVDALIETGVNVCCAFGPQHGMRGDKQDNMVETDDYADPRHGIPVYSLYGTTRRPADQMLEQVDAIIFDLQDVGCRVYTFITTLLYVLQACAERRLPLVVLDRPNPAGRPIDGLRLETGQESFVGCAPIPMRHGLTTGELAHWFVRHFELDVDLQVVAMQGYDPTAGPGFGWPVQQRSWVNPSPNASTLNMARCFPGTVMIEGTTLSEGRGTTTPLEVIGAPDIDVSGVLEQMRMLAPDWLNGVLVRPCHFQPTFHKHAHSLCHGLQLHTDHSGYGHGAFHPYRLVLLFLKSLRLTHPEYPLWHDNLYEYEPGRRAIDVINGSTWPADWVDDKSATVAELAEQLATVSAWWHSERKSVLLYPA